MSPSEMAGAATRGWLDITYNVMKKIAAILAAWGTIITTVWFLFGSQIEPYTSLPKTVVRLDEKLTTSVEMIQKDIGTVKDKVSSLEDRFSSALQPEVVQFDQFRSRVTPEQCRIGEECTAELYVRRTAQGATCGTPELYRNVRDSQGVVRAADNPFPQRPVRRAGTDWLVIANKFVVQTGTAIGDAVYFIELAYPDCEFAKRGEVVEATSPPLSFTLMP